MPEIFSWDSYVIILPFYITSANDGIRVKHPGSGTGFSTFLTIGNAVMWKVAISDTFLTAASVLLELQANLIASYNALYSNTDGSFVVELDSMLRIKITNNSPDGLTLDFPSAVFDSKVILGFASDQAAKTIDGGGDSFTAPFQPYGIWTPHFHYTRDTAHDPKKVRRKSCTETGRPSYTTHSDAHSIRQLKWEHIGSALIKYSRTKDSLFCDYVGVTVDDPHCYLQKWFDYIMDGSGPLPGRCYVSPTKDETTPLNGTTGSGSSSGAGPYWMDIPEEAVSGIGEEWLDQEAAVESYNPYFNLRLQS